MRLRAVAPAIAVIALACGTDPTGPPRNDPPPPAVTKVIAAAGDISCAPDSRAHCRQMDTATAVEWIAPDVVLALGDLQYERGEFANFLRMYAPSWGRFKAITRPAVGNHEYETPRASGYYDYFNGVAQQSGAAGDRGRGYYSFQIGAWHVVALNSNCHEVGGCHPGSPQEVWLRADLQSIDSRCTLAFFHHPLFSSGVNGGAANLRPLWQALYDFDADVILNGHEHLYERFMPQTPQGVPDSRRGIRQITVGTGGHSLTRFVTRERTSEVGSNQAFGVLKMELQPDSYTWEFIPAPGAAATFTDAGGQPCH